MIETVPEPAPAVTPETSPQSLIERVVRQLGLTSSSASVYGEPVGHGTYTVVPVARVYFMYGAGTGPELAGRTVERPPEGRITPALTSGGGAGGIGIARPAGHIEIGPEGTRFVPAGRDWRGLLAVAGAVWATVLLFRLPLGGRRR